MSKVVIIDYDSIKPYDKIGDYVLVPIKPTKGLLISMAIRYDHALGWPGYYDIPLFGIKPEISHNQRLHSTLTTMSQLHEEVVGTGFYSLDKENGYAKYADEINTVKESKNEINIKSNSYGFEDSEIQDSGC